jgi:RNA-binding protein 23/39
MVKKSALSNFFSCESVFVTLNLIFRADTDPDVFTDVEDAVREEVSNFGRIEHLFLDKPLNLVYLKVDSIKAAEQTVNLLNNRWFAAKLVTADYLPETTYDAKFQLSK